MSCLGNNLSRPCSHRTTPTAPAGYIAEDGGQPRSVAADATYAAGVAISANGDPLWYRVTCNGTDVRVRVATTQAGLDTAFTSYRGSFEGKLTGGFIGFRNGQSEYIDNVTIRTDLDNDGVYETEEMIEQFNTDPVEMRYDAAGNLTFDGNYAYTYDAWGRQVEVKRAFITKDANGAKTYHEGSTISTSLYDGRGRRIRKQITNSGDQDYTYIYYYDGYRIIEERNGADQTIKTYVWGNEYIDELLQINTYIGAPQSFWAMQDANYNVIGIVNETGRQVERYEYTPYGQRTIYGRQTVLTDVQEAASWANDSLLTYPQLTSARLSTTIPVTLCDFGHQGLKFDQETDQYDNRRRVYIPRHGRFPQRDPWGDIDGPNLYQYVRSNPVNLIDPNGTWPPFIIILNDQVSPPASRSRASTLLWDPSVRYSDGKYRYKAAFDATFNQSRCMLTIELRVQLNAADNNTALALRTLVPKWEQALAVTYNKWKLMPEKENKSCCSECRDGIQLDFRTHFSIGKFGPAHHVVNVNGAAMKEPDVENWYLVWPGFTDTTFLAMFHEVGHMYGLLDEYEDLKNAPERVIPDDALENAMSGSEGKSDILQRQIERIVHNIANVNKHLPCKTTVEKR